MVWVKLDDRFLMNKKVVQAGKDGRLLYLAGLFYSAGELTDGFVPADALRILAAQVEIGRPQHWADHLVKVGLWELREGGYAIHDYLEFNPTAEDVKRERAAARERMQGIRASRSANVRPNKERSSPNVRPKFATPVPGPIPVVEVPTELPSPAGAREAKKPNRVGEVVELVKAAGVPITISARDGRAVRECSADPSLIADAYIAAYRGDWDPGGDGFVRDRLAVHTVVPILAGYLASKNRPPKGGGRARGPTPNGAEKPPSPFAKYSEGTWINGRRVDAD